ncbi:MAG: hypothetical protein FWD05_13735 [Oscillospiraceae bacterium]|nr:hypothetical protein [Oscillospiraceae bacterium]
MCEVMLDKNGNLAHWTECRSMSPMGESVEGLIGDIQRSVFKAVTRRARSEEYGK